MEGLLRIKRTSAMTAERDRRLSEAIEREQPRLRNFIRKRVADAGDAEDILQEIFYELVEAYHLMKPVEQVGAWLFRVARNRITDLFRKSKRATSRTAPMATRGEWRAGYLGRSAPVARCRTRKRPMHEVCFW